MERIIELLKVHGIRVLVDVRRIPYSRHNPQFNREDFAEALERAGIRYEYAGERLGGRPRGTPPLEEIPEECYREGIKLLIELVSEWKTAILCSEEDPQKCHRHHLIAQSLLDEGVEVFHIRGDGRLEEAQREGEQLSLFSLSEP
jgi:uncharacterized protein (DUF488 family)